MKNNIKTIRLFPNNNEKSNSIVTILNKELIENGFEITKDDFDLGIAIGGDGTFLRMLKKTNFNSEAFYIGINTGTLGFLQEIKPDYISEFITKIKANEYMIEEIGIQETRVDTDSESSKFYSLNEIVVREKELNAIKLDIYVSDNLLEKFFGDGILISTSVGSTAYNLSYGGSIVYNNFHTLQITPIAPLNNKEYRNLLNSVVLPQEYMITLIPRDGKNDIMVTVDGENSFYNDVKKIVTVVNTKRINCLRLKDYNFINIINEKFLK